ncbi:MAG: nucleoside hydrolase [Clostridia bacterium]|nr:nucleoside hydrolase [Clostridia bacterium]
MINEHIIKNLSVPNGSVDVVLDTDAYNEIDDQFAIAYLLSCKDKLNTKAIYAAPFLNEKSKDAADGMEKSYDEILKILSLMKEDVDTFKGSNSFLKDEYTPIISPAALDLAERANRYSPDKPLYVIAIGAISNIASAILINPKITENCVVVWLGGHALHYHDTMEFNMKQDVAASRVVMSSGVPFVQLPCAGVVSSFTISKYELEFWFKGKNAIADYLAENTIRVADSYASGAPWTRCIWDVTAVAWLINDGDRFMESKILPLHLCDYNCKYERVPNGHPIKYVYYIKRDALMTDLIDRITSRD